MHKIILVLLIITLGISVGLFAQKKNNFSNVDKVMLKIPDSMTISTQSLANFINSNFSSQTDRARAIFIWIAKNIQYDIGNMFAINFYQNNDEVIDIALKTHKGICMHFAELFNDIANKVGIKSYVVTGYTKQFGFVDYVPHAWCVANIETNWYVFDPTWGSGYVDDSKYVKHVNNFYFKTVPGKIIKSHMPFDPLWQLIYYPVTCQEFYVGKNVKTLGRTRFNYVDSILAYEKQTEIERLISSSNRIEKNGVINTLVFEKLKHNKVEIEYYNKGIEYKKNKQKADQYNSATYLFNNGINLINVFINYKNKQFNPEISDSALKQMIDTVEVSFKLAQEKLNSIENPDSTTKSMIIQLNHSIENSLANLDEHKIFVEKYLATGKLKRKSLFYKK